ncbi:LytTR family DNA-binding domain-containing protein [Nonomuraea fuscirosea]|uniref:LytR/AlgR family response regulator transcription factor n=1 Tax=Nonomuraea fuscirosea TaxID=1291556 RepID=UPI002DDC5D97|nr:LytTR family DNA-binding domain-containing protein [Nonomuraea fuscirosea]WSA52204.1 LytTR family DNA-binding domain-containing protein [Nonomuraea fuscirosea]
MPGQSSHSRAARLRTLIVDHDHATRAQLERLLCRHQEVELVAACATARAAAEAMKRRRPDLVFLDPGRPEEGGLEVFDVLRGRRRPAVVLMAAAGAPLPGAAEVHEVDRLVKPCDRVALQDALARVVSHLAADGRSAGTSPLDRFSGGERVAGPPPLSRLPIEGAGRIQFLDLAAIDYIRAEGKYARIHVGSRTHLVRGTLTLLQERLDPRTFLRVHRSLIVRLDRIREVEILRHGELRLFLSTGDSLISGRTYRDQLRLTLGLPT